MSAPDETYEPDMAAVMDRHVRPGWRCADLGAHHGEFTLPLARKVGPEGHVTAFDAWEENAQTLSRRAEREGLAERITVVHAAVTDGREPEVFIYPGRRRKDNGLRSDWEWSVTGYHAEGEKLPPDRRVRALSLDQYFPAGERLDLVKIDIEGAAALALAGMRWLLSQARPVVALEFHDAAEWAARRMLFAAGYDLFRASGEPIPEKGDPPRVFHCYALPRA
ncbi:MAG: FkbM family methyltransferase [Planctomycetes bacterium]|nr:FkbM family methyltransferase [Planctomycetota bacterium]